MTGWGTAWGVLLAATLWFLGLGLFRFLAASRVEPARGERTLRPLALATLGLGCLCAIAFLVVSAVILNR